MTAPWWTGTPAAETRLACGPNVHRLRWEAGSLTPLDHADPAVEAVLSQLGGDEPACLTLCRYWADHTADPRLLTLASRHPGDTLTIGDGDVARVRSLLAEDAVRRRHLERGGPAGAERTAAGERQLGLVSLLALDPAIVRRLQSEVAHHLGTEPLSAPNRVILEAATVGRLGPIARRWSASKHPPEVVLGERPGAGVTGPHVTVTVRPSWLAEIWGRYLGVVDHFLILDVHRIVEDRAEVTGVGAPGGQPARLILRGPAPWHVQARPDPTS